MSSDLGNGVLLDGTMSLPILILIDFDSSLTSSRGIHSKLAIEFQEVSSEIRFL